MMFSAPFFRFPWCRFKSLIGYSCACVPRPLQRFISTRIKAKLIKIRHHPPTKYLWRNQSPIFFSSCVCWHDFQQTFEGVEEHQKDVVGRHLSACGLWEDLNISEQKTTHTLGGAYTSVRIKEGERDKYSSRPSAQQLENHCSGRDNKHKTTRALPTFFYPSVGCETFQLTFFLLLLLLFFSLRRKPSFWPTAFNRVKQTMFNVLLLLLLLCVLLCAENIISAGAWSDEGGEDSR